MNDKTAATVALILCALGGMVGVGRYGKQIREPRGAVPSERAALEQAPALDWIAITVSAQGPG